MRFERRPRFLKGLRRPVEIARYEREFGLGYNVPRTRYRLSWTERARGFLERGFCPNEIAALRRCDAAQRERRRVVAQGAEGIAPRERTRSGRDQRVHRNPATLVTLTVRCPVLIYLMTANQHVTGSCLKGFI